MAIIGEIAPFESGDASGGVGRILRHLKLRIFGRFWPFADIVDFSVNVSATLQDSRSLLSVDFRFTLENKSWQNSRVE